MCRTVPRQKPEAPASSPLPACLLFPSVPSDIFSLTLLFSLANLTGVSIWGTFSGSIFLTYLVKTMTLKSPGNNEIPKDQGVTTWHPLCTKSISEENRLMKCQRCIANEARHYAFSDIVDAQVCTPCAIKALELGLTVKAIPGLRTNHQPSYAEGSQDHYGVLTRGLSYYSDLYLGRS